MSTPESPPTSPGLLHLLGGENNVAAWARFLERYLPLIDDWCRLAGLQAAGAEDVRSSVLKGLVTALREFRYDPIHRFRGYLRTAVNNAIRKCWIERNRKPGNYGTGGDAFDSLENLIGPADPSALAASLDNSVSEDLRELYRAVERVRSQVSSDSWQAYLRIVIEGKPAAQVALELGKSVAAVYMAKSRVGKLLRDEGQHELGDSQPE